MGSPPSMTDENPSSGPATAGKKASGSFVSCQECNGKLVADSVRGEKYCRDCGCVSQEKMVDFDHPDGTNSGRSKLSTGRARMDFCDGLGIPIPKNQRRRYDRLGKIQENLDRRKRSEETNRVVENAMEIVRKELHYPNEELIERSRRLLMGVLTSCQNSGTALFKTGSKWNGEAAALACMNIGSRKESLYRRIDGYANKLGLTGKVPRGLRRRTMDVWALLMLHDTSNDGYKWKRESPRFVVPHKISVPLLELFSEGIRCWLSRRRDSFAMARVRFPAGGDVDDSVSRVLSDPHSIGLSGGEHLEPVLDAILLVLADRANPELDMAHISKEVGMSASARNYTRRVKNLLSE